MANKFKRMCAFLLSGMMLLSCLSGVTAFAEENRTSAQTQSAEPEANSSASEQVPEDEIRFYGATGDLTLEEGNVQTAETIDSVSEYYDQINSSQKKSLHFSAPASVLPAQVDNSQSIYFPEIRSQGSIGSCTCWAQTYYQFTYTMNKTLGRATTPQNTFSPKFTYNLINNGEDRGSVASIAYDFLEKQGAVTLEQVPYDYDYLSWSPEADIWASAGDYRVKDYQYLSYGSGNTPITGPKDPDLDVLKTALSNGEILTYSTFIRSWNYKYIETNASVPENSKHTGDYIAVAMNGVEGSHRMTIVGYNDDLWVDINGDGAVQEQEKGAFKIANSWGTNYADSGFAWVSYDALNRVSSVPNVSSSSNRGSIFSWIARIDVETYDSDSDIILQYTLNSKARNQTKVYVEAVKGNTKISKVVSPYNVSAYEVAPYSYDGTVFENDGTMCFDLGNVVEGLDSESFQDYSWSVRFVDEKADGIKFTVKDARILDKNTGDVLTLENSYPFTLDGTSKTISFTGQNNMLTVYYKGYSTPYIHYQIGTGNWTNVPGYAMTATSEMSGYTHKYTIDLGGADYANICFNDGNGNWDSNNGQNYRVTAGTYTYKNGVFTPADPNAFRLTGFEMTPKDGKLCVGDVVSLKTAAENYGSSGYLSEFTIYKGGREYAQYPYGYATQVNMQMSTPGTYTAVARVKETPYSEEITSQELTFTVAEPSIKKLNTSVASPQVKDTKIILSAETENISSALNYSYTVTKDGVKTKLKTNTDKTAEWIPSEAGTYTIELELSLGGLSICTESQEYIITDEIPLQILHFSCNYGNSKLMAYSSMAANASAGGGTAPYTYQYGVIKQNGEKVELDPTENTFVYFRANTFAQGDILTPYVRVTDAAGTVITKTLSSVITVDGLRITEFNAEPQSPQPVNTKIHFSYKTENEITYQGISNGIYKIYKDGSLVTTVYSTHGGNWTPSEAGTYTIELSVTDYAGQTASKTMQYTVTDPSENEVTIYYKGYSTPYIHYQVGTGSWTSVPGCAMTATSEMSGYTHKYSIDLGSSGFANVCFNDGNGNWDSNNGQNYRVTAGVYTYSNGKFTPVEEDVFGIASFEITPADGRITAGDVVDMKVTLKNASPAAVCQFSYEKDGKEVIIYNYSSASGGSKQFTEAGTYKLIVRAKDNPYSDTVVTAEKTITVLPEDGNTVTIYYKGYSTPYIHYQVGTGSWTSVPGCAMTATSEMSGYTHKYSIDLGSSGFANVCFNDGNGNWDSNNGQNYRVTAGVYTYSNGKFTPVEENVFGIASFEITPADGRITAGDIVDMKVTLKNASPAAVCQFSYEKDGKEVIIYNYSSASGGSKQFTEAGTYKLIVRAKDNPYSDTVVTAEKTITVLPEDGNTVTIYYKGYSTPYIHYQVGTGSWTDVPGCAMTATSEMSGYTHKYSIDLGSSGFANVCFNDGNGNWDSNNGQNYRFETGVYTYQNGQLNKIA